MHELAITLAPQRRKWHRRNTEESSLLNFPLRMCDCPVPVCQRRISTEKYCRNGKVKGETVTRREGRRKTKIEDREEKKGENQKHQVDQTMTDRHAKPKTTNPTTQPDPDSPTAKPKDRQTHSTDQSPTFPRKILEPRFKIIVL